MQLSGLACRSSSVALRADGHLNLSPAWRARGACTGAMTVRPRGADLPPRAGDWGTEAPPLPNQDGNARKLRQHNARLIPSGSCVVAGDLRPDARSRIVAWFSWCGKCETQVRG